MSDRQNAFGPGPAALYRDPEHGWIAGVCAGIADHFGATRWGIRLIALVLAIFFFIPAAIAYVVLAVMLKRKPLQLFKDAEDAEFWRSVARRPADTASGLVRRFRELEVRLVRLERRVTSPEETLKAQFRNL